MNSSQSAQNDRPNTYLNWVVGAGIVGADIGTSIFYGTGILFPIVGYLAPIFVLTTCLMMWIFKRTYEEGLALSPYNGGAYSMILRTIGRRFAVLAGTLTFVSYLATAAVSALSGGLYITSLFGPAEPSLTVTLISFIPILFFAILNSKGIKEPAKLVTVIAGAHFFLLLIIVIWGTTYLLMNLDVIDFSKLNQLTPTGEITLATIAYGVAAAFLGITGFESAAQIVEELEPPTLPTVRKLYKTVIILVSLTAPAISCLCLLILTREEVDQNLGALLSQLARTIGGKVLLTIVVVDATLTLFAAVNTAFVGFIGLATTMAKQGNLPQFFLKRVEHKWPSITGYPFIAFSFAGIAMLISAYVAGALTSAAKVYEIAFLGVMVSFCIGVVLMRNRSLRRNTPKQFLSRGVRFKNMNIPLPPLVAGVVLTLATFTLLSHASDEVLFMLTLLFSSLLLLMVYFRWGQLEKRLETRSDLRLGIGDYAKSDRLPEDLPEYVLCTGGSRSRHLIEKAVKYILFRQPTKPFELVIFHAEEGKDPEGFFFEQLQRVVSEQISPTFNEFKRNFILTVKILPGNLMEGLQTLKKSHNFDQVLFGTGTDPEHGSQLAKDIKEELELDVHRLKMEPSK